jgi:hypothetical protein
MPFPLPYGVVNIGYYLLKTSDSKYNLMKKLGNIEKAK